MYDYRVGDIVRRVGISKHMRWVRGFCSHINRPVNSFFSVLYSGFLYMFMNVYRCTSVCVVCVCMWVGGCACVCCAFACVHVYLLRGG